VVSGMMENTFKQFRNERPPLSGGHIKEGSFDKGECNRLKIIEQKAGIIDMVKCECFL